MAIIDSINQGRKLGASDDQILDEIIKNNPNKQAQLEQSRALGANATQILDEISRQNAPAVGKQGRILGGILGDYISRVGKKQLSSAYDLAKAPLEAEMLDKEGRELAALSRRTIVPFTATSKIIAAPVTEGLSMLAEPLAEPIAKGIGGIFDVVNNYNALLEQNPQFARSQPDALKNIAKAVEILQSETPKLMQEYETFKKTNPELAENLENIASIAGSATDIFGAAALKQPAQQVFKDVAGRTAKAIQAGKNIPIPINKVDTAENLAMRAFQVTKDNVEPALRVAPKIKGLTFVKSFEEGVATITNFIRSKVQNLQRIHEKGYARTRLKISAKKPFIDGQESIQTAISDLQDMFVETQSTSPDREIISKLAAKYADEGLTSGEVNELARIYGNNRSGFNAKGVLSPSDVKVRFENVRTSLKSTARGMLPPKLRELATDVDLDISDALTLRRRSQSLSKLAQQEANRLRKTGVLEKTASTAIQAIDTATGGTIKGAIRGLGIQTTGGSRISILELQKEFPKLLKQLTKQLEKNPVKRNPLSPRPILLPPRN